MAEAPQPNRPLTGTELRKIIANDVSSILEQDGMLAGHIAYKRAAYSVTVKIMTDNPMLMGGSWKTDTRSRGATAQEIDGNESLAALEKFPLAGELSEDHLESGLERTRKIESPNQSRIENGLPVVVTSRGSDGEVKEHEVKYEAADLPEDAYPDNVVDRELSEDEINEKA